MLPPPPVGPGGEDSITTSEGVRCSQSINSSGGYLDLGVAGGDLSNYYDSGGDFGSDNGAPQSAVAYARVIIPLGEAPTRLNCARLYELEIQKLKSEIEMLKVGLE
ncbi:MAG: hypothetical protein JWQ89_3584 [Devosia sp.]|uniref:hypothetical protein n=1 Tax=Devosia sp. TaxID=1871048 RepID=UPI00263588DD|nr:hypothetical protein [Devosia sp.]MDB5541857.1 hypothetical protein [Devosia sp.]